MTKLSDTLYSKYVAERLNAQILENEFGFIVYQITQDAAFIVDMYVKEELRQKGQGKELLNQLCKIASDLGKTQVTASVFLWDKNASKTLISALLSGFELFQAHNGSILICKQLGG